MTEIRSAYVWRDYVVDGVPSSGDHPVNKAEIREWGANLEGIVDQAASGTSSIAQASWAALSSVTGSFLGQKAEVLDADSGTHTDPVVGGTVANSGTFQWSISPSGWKRIGTTGLAGKASGSINAKVSTYGASISAASTVNLATATGDYVDVGGVANITSLGSSSDSGLVRTIRFGSTAAGSVLVNSASLVLPGAKDITVQSGDIARFRQSSAGTWICEEYARGTGRAITNPNRLTKRVNFNSGTATAWVGASNKEASAPADDDAFYATGQVYVFLAYSNTGPVTVNIDGLGAIDLQAPNGDAIQSGQLIPGQMLEGSIIYVSSVAKLRLHTPVKATTANVQAGDAVHAFTSPDQVTSEIDRRIAATGLLQKASTRIGSATDGINVAGGWSASLATLSIDSSKQRRTGKSTVKVTGDPTGAVSCYVRKAIPSGVTLTGKIEWHLNIPKPSVGTIGILPGWSATAPAADPPSATPSNTKSTYYGPTDRADGIWTIIDTHPSVSYFSTGRKAGGAWYSTQSLPAPIQYIELVVQFSADVPSAERVLWIDEVGINGYTRPSIMLGFDGFYQSQVSVALPLFKEKGFKGYASSAPKLFTTDAQAATYKARTDALYAAGWDILQQGQRNGDAAPNGYATNQSTLAADIIQARSQLQAAGYIRGLDIMTYPYNARSAASDAVLAANGIVMAGSTGNEISRTSAGIQNPLAFGRYLTDGNTAAQMIAAIDAAIIGGRSLMMFGHDLVTTITDTTIHTSISEYSTMLDYLANKAFEGKCEVILPSEYRAKFVR